jgi:type I restriction-modification system DNA methylase subunit
MLSRLKFNLSQLANEMLDQLPEQVFISDSTTFYDPAMGGGQFLIEVVNRLRKYNHFDANISKRIFGSEENKLRVNYVKNLHKLPGEFRTELIEDMKFDVVIGNPPFQELDNNGRSKANSGSNLYGRFIDLGIKVLKENGYLSLISPIA